MAQYGKLKGKTLLFIVSFFGTGLISKRMPGTVGSFAAMLLLLVLPRSCALVFIVFIVSFFAGLLCCNAYIPKYETNKDPGYIVIDEACGIFLSATILYYFGFSSNFDLILAFALFRIFDILKPFPICTVEKYCMTHQGIIAFGIMLDDIVASLAAAMTQIVL